MEDLREFFVDLGRALCFILVTVAITAGGIRYESAPFWVIEIACILLWVLGKIDNEWGKRRWSK